MVASIPQIIAAINPDLYYDGTESDIKKFKKLVEDEGLSKAAEKAKPKAQAEHKLVYDSPTETLEPIYFFILDLMNDLRLNPEKLVDNFVSSPGSQHFGDIGQRRTYMEKQGAELLGNINAVLRSVLNIIYDLREFKVRLSAYDDLKNSNRDVRSSALLSLKQIWMDKVDIQKGNSSIKAMALGQGGFNTLIDAFLIVEDESLKGPDGAELDLNEIVKRLLRPRIYEFNKWVKESEGELRKRYQIEKTYLKSQVSSLKLYARWARPYLKAAQELEMSEKNRNPDLVKMFNSLLLELTLFGKQSLKVQDEAKSGNFPPFFANEKFLATVNETYNSCVLVDFHFRGIPSRTQAGFVVGGRAEVIFRGYSLTGSEIKQMYEELDKSDLDGALGLIDGATNESLGALKDDIEAFLNEDKKEEEKVEKKKGIQGENPFFALFGFYNKKDKQEKKEKKEKEKKLKSPYKKHFKWYEKEYFFPAVKSSTTKITKTLFETYKKAHGMPAYSAPPWK